MELLKRIYNRIGRHLHEPNVNHRPIFNINFDITRNQKRVAIVYTNSDFYEPFYSEQISHSNSLSVYPKIKYFIDNDYVIDLYECRNTAPEILSDFKYDVIFGFGKLYTLLCQRNPEAIKILYITENAPWIVKEKYQERLVYFEQRHGRVPHTVQRTGFYTKEMFELSDVGIAGNGKVNIDSMLTVLADIRQIHIPAIFNDWFAIDGMKDHKSTKKNFVWFGSAGAIHKGLDILIDAFARLPELTLDIYGAIPSEIKTFSLPSNVHDRGFVKVKSPRFIDEVVNRHSFVVSISCSEAFQSSVSTCMAHGLIPIVTPETGFDNLPNSIICEDFHIDYISKILLSSSQINDSTLSYMENQIFNYVRKNFSVSHVNEEFYTIMDNILVK